MITLKKLLVPTDLSDHSRAAIEHAASFRLLYDARLYLLFVQEEVAPVGLAIHNLYAGGEAYRKRNESEAIQALNEFAGRLDPGVMATPVVRFGDPGSQIVQFARDENIDLIVMATHGRTGLGHVLMGSVAERVVRTSPVAVLTVKPAPIAMEFPKREDVEKQLHIR